MAQEIVTLLAYNTAIFTGLFAAVWLVKTVFKKRLNARLQYILWGILVLKLLIPFSVTAPWSPYVLAQRIDVNSPAAFEHVDIYDEATENLSRQNIQAEPVNPALQSVQNDKATELQEGLASVQDVENPKPFRVDWMALIACTWMAGALVCGIGLGLRSRQLRKFVLRSQTDPAPEWMERMFEKYKTDLGLSRWICIAVQGGLPVPAVMGVFRPVLLVPQELANNKDIERMRHVLTHELMHCKRHDLWALWLLNALCAVYWFNPLVWLGGRLACRDMEAACDEMVVSKLGTCHRQGYIETILHFSGKK